MWIIGLLGFYIIYRLIFRWYMKILLKMGYNPGLAPGFFRYRLIHYSIYVIAICIFCISTYCFYTVNPWMVLLSPLLLFVSMLVDGAKTGSRRDKIIASAVRMQVSMEAQGLSQTQINDAICLATLGDCSDLGNDMELKQLLKHYILPTLGLFTAARALRGECNYDPRTLGRYMKDSDEIDTIIEHRYQYHSSILNARK
jgi:hypothetical protein